MSKYFDELLILFKTLEGQTFPSAEALERQIRHGVETKYFDKKFTLSSKKQCKFFIEVTDETLIPVLLTILAQLTALPSSLGDLIPLLKKQAEKPTYMSKLSTELQQTRSLHAHLSKSFSTFDLESSRTSDEIQAQLTTIQKLQETQRKYKTFFQMSLHSLTACFQGWPHQPRRMACSI